jgi:hypothetical protein
VAKVKVFLEPHETEDDARDLLLKALTHHEGGGEHQEAFAQPAARDVFNRMILEHDRMWAKMLKEIAALIDEEVG